MTGEHRGRHARPPSRLRVLAEQVLDEENRRWVKLAGGVSGAVAFAVLGLVVLPEGGAQVNARPQAAVHAGQSGKGGQADKGGKAGEGGKAARSAVPTAAPQLGVDPDEVPEAVAYMRIKDPGGRYVKHVTEVRRSGAFLRVYTDLGEGDDNSRTAISICEWATEYLRKFEDDDQPIVFVHAQENDNGNVVLANKQSASDDCRVGGTR